MIKDKKDAVGVKRKSFGRESLSGFINQRPWVSDNGWLWMDVNEPRYLCIIVVPISLGNHGEPIRISRRCM